MLKEDERVNLSYAISNNKFKVSSSIDENLNNIHPDFHIDKQTDSIHTCDIEESTKKKIEFL